MTAAISDRRPNLTRKGMARNRRVTAIFARRTAAHHTLLPRLPRGLEHRAQVGCRRALAHAQIEAQITRSARHRLRHDRSHVSSRDHAAADVDDVGVADGELLPALRTVGEAVEGKEAGAWVHGGFAVKAGTPDDVIATLSDATAAAFDNDEFRASIPSSITWFWVHGVEDTTALIQSGRDLYSPILDSIGLLHK